MDEPCSALDPISTLAIEDLINELKSSTPSSSSPTTCSRPLASPTRRPSSTSPPRGREVDRGGLHQQIFNNPDEQATEDYLGRFEMHLAWGGSAIRGHRHAVCRPSPRVSLPPDGWATKVSRSRAGGGVRLRRSRRPHRSRPCPPPTISPWPSPSPSRGGFPGGAAQFSWRRMMAKIAGNTGRWLQTRDRDGAPDRLAQQSDRRPWGRRRRSPPTGHHGRAASCQRRRHTALRVSRHRVDGGGEQPLRSIGRSSGNRALDWSRPRASSGATSRACASWIAAALGRAGRPRAATGPAPASVRGHQRPQLHGPGNSRAERAPSDPATPHHRSRLTRLSGTADDPPPSTGPPWSPARRASRGEVMGRRRQRQPGRTTRPGPPRSHEAATGHRSPASGLPFGRDQSS